MTEEKRQLTIRALALQSLHYPGLRHASREIATDLRGAEMFDEFEKVLLNDGQD